MKCQMCGTEIGENDQFCYNCGHKISPEAVLVEDALSLDKENSNDTTDSSNIKNSPDFDIEQDVDKPIKSRFAAVSPDEFDYHLEKAEFGDNENLNTELPEINPSEEDKINEALQKESGQLFNGSGSLNSDSDLAYSDTIDSNLNSNLDPNSGPDSYSLLEEDSNLDMESNSNLNEDVNYNANYTDSPKTKKPMFLAMVGLIILVFASGVVFLSNPGDLIPYIPLLQNQTNDSQEDATVQQVETEKLHNQNKSSNKDSVCSLCGGKGVITCPTCGGSGFLTCSECGGTGLVDGNECPSCGGSGKIICTDCQATGSITCPECGGSGKAS